MDAPLPQPAGEAVPKAAAVHHPVLLLLLGLSLLTLTAYLPALRNGFVNYDDPQYVLENPHVRQGLSVAGLRWALGAEVAANWHPLTLLSHMLDVELFGLNPKGHHLTSVMLHLAAVLALFEVLRRMTGAAGRSAAVAALFAVHPTHVESVAWIAERKDVLCGFFWMLALGAWLHYVRAPTAGRYLRYLRYLVAAAAFAASLMAKPMAVTFPAVLLLLDLWPLGRWPLGGGPAAGRPAAVRRQSVPAPAVDGGSPPRTAARGRWRLVAEKAPLFALAAAAAATALRAQAEPLTAGADASLALRFANALTSCVSYLGKTLDPRHLAVFYPFTVVPAGRAAAAAILLVTLTALTALMVRRAPYLLVGWLWYLVTLAPVSGVLQVGWQGMADRYTYLPSIGLYLAAVWGVADLATRRRPFTHWPRGRQAAAVAAGLLLLAALTAATRRQVATWSDTLSLFRHALEVQESYLAHTNVAEELRARGDQAGALVHYRAAVALAPHNPRAHAALGNALRAWGLPAAALPPLRSALALDPADEQARVTLAMALDDLGHPDQAMAELRRVLAFHPDSARAHAGLAALGALAGRSTGPQPR
jgi:Flp pilus assembly protein TadD